MRKFTSAVLVVVSGLLSSSAFADGGFSFAAHQGKVELEAGSSVDQGAEPGLAFGFEAEAGNLDKADLMTFRLNGSSLGNVTLDSMIRPGIGKTLDLELNPMFVRKTPLALRTPGILTIATSGLFGVGSLRIEQSNGSGTTVGVRPLGGFRDERRERHSQVGENAVVVTTRQKLPGGLRVDAEASAALISWLASKEFDQQGVGTYLSGTVGLRKDLTSHIHLRAEASADDLRYKGELLDGSSDSVADRSYSGMLMVGGSFGLKSEEFKEKQRAEAASAADEE